MKTLPQAMLIAALAVAHTQAQRPAQATPPTPPLVDLSRDAARLVIVETWSVPQELPAELTGDRHAGA